MGGSDDGGVWCLCLAGLVVKQYMYMYIPLHVIHRRPVSHPVPVTALLDQVDNKVLVASITIVLTWPGYRRP